MSVQHKRLAGLAAGLALLTLVTGCGAGAKPASETPSKSTTAKAVELTVQTWPGINAEVLANVDSEFTAKHPNVKVTLKDGGGKPPGTAIDSTYLDGIDVVFMNDNQVSNLVTNKLLKDLSAVKVPQTNDAVAGVFNEMGKVEGKRYALPVAITPSMIMINEQAITKAGLKVPSTDWTWQDFQQALTATKGAGVNNQVTLQGILDPFLRAYGGQLYDADKQQFVFDSAAAKQGLAALQPFVKNGLVQAEFGGAFRVGPGPGDGGGGPGTQVNMAPAFMAFGGNVFIRGGQTQSLPYPKGPKGRPSPATGTVAAVSASSPNVDMAVEYVKELLNNATEQLAMAKGSIRPVTNDAKALAAWQQAVGDQTAKATEAALPDVYLAGQIPTQNAVINGLLPYLNGTAALDSTVSTLMSSLNK
ncbi:MAG TPA: extracellular solute-binding protein [Symbiobacteriaceae bacterium]